MSDRLVAREVEVRSLEGAILKVVSRPVSGVVGRASSASAYVEAARVHEGCGTAWESASHELAALRNEVLGSLAF